MFKKKKLNKIESKTNKQAMNKLNKYKTKRNNNKIISKPSKLSRRMKKLMSNCCKKMIDRLNNKSNKGNRKGNKRRRKRENKANKICMKQLRRTRQSPRSTQKTLNGKILLDMQKLTHR